MGSPEKISVLNPMGFAPKVVEKPLAPRLSTLEGKAHTVHGANDPAVAREPRPTHRELLLELLHFEERPGHHSTTGQATKCPGSRSSSPGSCTRQVATA